MRGSCIMTTGKQLAGLLLLTTALTFPGMALAQDAASPMADQAQPSDAGDDADAQADQGGPEISIPGGTIVVKGRINRDPVRNSTQVIDVLSTEDIARTGEGDIAGALGKVTGLSVVEGGKVFVRGLGDRYSLALLNGLPLPSPEPLSRVVPLDIFPTNVVASSLVQKTYSPNFPGEFGGGVINLTTTAVPDEAFLKISGSLSGDTETTFQNGYAYYGSGSDWTGFDNGARDVPAVLQNYFDQTQNGDLQVQDLITDLGGGRLDYSGVEDIARVLTPPIFATLQQIGDLRANFSAGISAGTAFDVGDNGRLGLVLTGSLSNKYRNRVISRQRAGNEDTEIQRDESDFVTNNNMLANAMFSLGLEIDDHVFRLTNLLIRDTVKTAGLNSFTRPFEFEGFEYLEQNTAWFERQLIDSQFVGEMEFGELSVDLRGGYARTDREAPYNLTYTYGRDANAAEGTLQSEYQLALQTGQAGFSETGIGIAFSDLTEELWFGGADISYELTPDLTATIGYAYSDTARISTRRSFRPRVELNQGFYVTDPDTGEAVEALSVDDLRDILSAVNLRSPQLLLNGATYNLFDVTLDDFDFQDPAFAADLTVHAGYVQAQFVYDTLTVQGGVRYERSLQVTTPLGAQSQGQQVTVAGGWQDNWLPALTLTWEPAEDLQLRLSGSKTLARPQFRELVSQRYFDPETNRNYTGNPFMTDSELINLEARAEYYAGGRNKVSLAGFYKDISDPIEVYIRASGADQFISYANAPKARLYGVEADAQYYLDLFNLGDFFESKQLVLLANYTYTNSELQVSQQPGEDQIIISQGVFGTPTDAFNVFTDGAPLVGQSDHLVNLQFGIEDIDRLQQLTVLLSYASERVSLRGFRPLPDVIEKPGASLDVVFRQGFNLAGTEAELKLEARNLLGTRHQEYQINAVGLRIENNTFDVGQSFGASLSIEF